MVNSIIFSGEARVMEQEFKILARVRVKKDGRYGRIRAPVRIKDPGTNKTIEVKGSWMVKLDNVTGAWFAYKESELELVAD
jgi:hypothetical protein